MGLLLALVQEAHAQDAYRLPMLPSPLKRRRLSPVQAVALLAMLGIELPTPDPARAFRRAAWLWFQTQRDDAIRLGA